VKIHITRRATLMAVTLVGLLLVGAPTLALVQPATTETLDAVDVSETIVYGGTDVDLRQAAAEGFEIPVVTVAFSQYPYVVSYLDPAVAARELDSPDTIRQFGQPSTIRTTDLSSVPVELDERGFLHSPPGASPTWTAASAATYVIDSRARIPSGPVALGFSDPVDAESFASTYGGRTVSFERLDETTAAPDRQGRFDAALGDRMQWAEDLLDVDRNRSDVTVSSDRYETVQAAIRAAPPGATVSVPAGRYAVETVVIDKPLTIQGTGEDSVIAGDGSGTPMIVRGPNVTIRDLRIEGVGSVGAREFRGADWDTTIQLAYGGGDAAIVVDGGSHTLVENVHIDTPASGIIGREATQLRVHDVTVVGARSAADGFMGVIVIGEPALIDGVTVQGGRDGVYTHRADGTVIRGANLSAYRYGMHLMYTSEALMMDNTVRGGDAGVMIMTRPEGNLVVGNDIADTTYGIVPAGGDSYIADNTVVGTQFGIQIAGDRHLVTRNRVQDSVVGLRANEIFPTNTVTRNDIVGTERPVVASLGPLRTWTDDGVGNYWGPLPALDSDGDGSYDRPFRPTATHDQRLVEEPAGAILTRAPAMQIRRAAGVRVSGLRGPGVIDTAPATEPFTAEVRR
jgi:nitrous oxidase accessory protein NosD